MSATCRISDHLDLGFRRDHVLLVTLDPAHSGYSREQLSRPYQELLGRLEAIPGVRSATLSAGTPHVGRGRQPFRHRAKATRNGRRIAAISR